MKSPNSPYLVPFDGSFKLRDFSSKAPDDIPDKTVCEALLAEKIVELSELQYKLFAQDERSVLLIFQAMDSAGKDSTIRAVLSGLDPAGCQVFAFKQPSKEELDHDFLWRSACRLPERGRIGVFNRSYYEEVLVVKVHPEFLRAQRLPGKKINKEFWKHRYESIRDHEKHLHRNGTVILKFWLNVSKEEQRQRFLSRLNEPKKYWKFSDADVQERKRWDDYMKAYQKALNETSREWAPWYAIPADNKHFMRLTVANIIVDTLKNLKLQFPTVSEDSKSDFARCQTLLENEG